MRSPTNVNTNKYKFYANKAFMQYVQMVEHLRTQILYEKFFTYLPVPKICCYRALLCSHGNPQVRGRDVPAAPLQLSGAPEAGATSPLIPPPSPSPQLPRAPGCSGGLAPASVAPLGGQKGGC